MPMTTVGWRGWQTSAEDAGAGMKDGRGIIRRRPSVRQCFLVATNFHRGCPAGDDVLAAPEESGTRPPIAVARPRRREWPVTRAGSWFPQLQGATWVNRPLLAYVIAVVAAGLLGCASSASTSAGRAAPVNTSAPRVLVSAFWLGDRQVGRAIADSTWLVLAQGLHRDQIQSVSMDRILIGLTWDPPGPPWGLDDLRSLAKLFSLSAIVEVDGRRLANGQIQLAPELIQGDALPVLLSRISAPTVGSAADLLAQAILTDKAIVGIH